MRLIQRTRRSAFLTQRHRKGNMPALEKHAVRFMNFGLVSALPTYISLTLNFPHTSHATLAKCLINPLYENYHGPSAQLLAVSLMQPTVPNATCQQLAVPPESLFMRLSYVEGKAETARVSGARGRSLSVPPACFPPAPALAPAG